MRDFYLLLLFLSCTVLPGKEVKNSVTPVMESRDTETDDEEIKLPYKLYCGVQRHPRPEDAEKCDSPSFYDTTELFIEQNRISLHRVYIEDTYNEYGDKESIVGSMLFEGRREGNAMKVILDYKCVPKKGLFYGKKIEELDGCTPEFNESHSKALKLSISKEKGFFFIRGSYENSFFRKVSSKYDSPKNKEFFLKCDYTNFDTN